MADLTMFPQPILDKLLTKLQHARDNRPGGLLVGERVAMEKLETEQARRKNMM